MPSMADITIKKNDGTTDIVWTGVSASNGVGVPAVWQSQTVGTAQSHRPDFRLSAKDNGRARGHRCTFVYPFLFTNSTTGLTQVSSRFTFDGNFSAPKEMTQTNIDEAVAQLANLLKATLIQSCLKAGVSAT